jgi:filamentous hemagglutinin family protein
MGRGESTRGVRGRLSAAYRNNTAIFRWLLCAPLAMVGTPALAGGALPTGGHYTAGQGTITGSANALTVNQSSNHGIINWQGFSIGAGNRVQFNNGSGATLNRVTGKNLSRIDGSLSATGSVYLINPQGVVVGPGGKVVTNGSFVASTRDVSDSAFMSGGALSASGTSNGDVVNAGTITSANGDAILVGRSVKNTGSISAPNGTAVMAAGNEILLQPVGGDSRIAVSGGKGDVTNAGTVKAAQAALASAGGNVYALVENNGGINATGTANIGGHVWLTAGGTAQVSGNVSATNADGSGGAVTALARTINVSGTVEASATNAGKTGGNVSIVASGDTTVTGTIKAKGKEGGRGGTVETSGLTLTIGGATVDAGEGGQWLLDPYDLTVDSSAASTIDSSLDGGADVTLQTTASGASGFGTANSSGNGDIFINSALSWSGTGTLTLDAYRSIDINANVTVAGGGGVVLRTNDNADGITSGDYSFANGASLSFTGGSSSGASLEINNTSYRLLYDMGDDPTGVQGINDSDATLQGRYALATSLDATGVTGWTPLGTNGAGSLLNGVDGFSGIFDGLGNTISNLTVDIHETTNAGLFGASSGTIRDIGLIGGSVTGGSDVGALAGSNGGTIVDAYATGAVNGKDGVGGLVGQNTSSGQISNAYATGAVDGTGSSVGGLAGYNGGTIVSAYATGSVFGGDEATGDDEATGGLVGLNKGTITDTYATGAVTGAVTGSANVGGLVGYNGGTITNAWAAGAVTGDSNVGGLLGENASGTIAEAYATGAVSGNNYVGGLLGENASGTIAEAYATGAVSGSSHVGGLVGDNFAGISAIQNAYWNTETTGQDSAGTNTSPSYVTALTTGEMQGRLTFPNGNFDSAIWGTGAGL